MIGDYTLAAAVAPPAAIAVAGISRTGLLRTARFWGTVLIMMACQIPVDGWLTKLSAPIVIYNAHAISGVRWPWDIPIEDFGFGFALVTVTLVSWEHARRQNRSDRPGSAVSRRGDRTVSGTGR